MENKEPTGIYIEAGEFVQDYSSCSILFEFVQVCLRSSGCHPQVCLRSFVSLGCLFKISCLFKTIYLFKIIYLLPQGIIHLQGQ